jgi:hypothetical protein
MTSTTETTPYDPAEHSVAEVNDHLATLDRTTEDGLAEFHRILQAESDRGDKARSTITGKAWPDPEPADGGRGEDDTAGEGDDGASTPPDPYDNPTSTTLDSDVTRPSTTAPGDGPADTTDPNERATSITPRPGPEALAAGTVNAVQPLPKAATKRSAAKAKERTERYTGRRPDGTEVTVERNIDTGETKLV